MKTYDFDLEQAPAGAFTSAEKDLIRSDPSTPEARSSWWALVVRPFHVVPTPLGDVEQCLLRTQGGGNLRPYLYDFLEEVSEGESAETQFWETLTRLIQLILSDARLQRKMYREHQGWSPDLKSEKMSRYDLSELFDVEAYVWRGIGHKDVELVAGKILEYKAPRLAHLIPCDVRKKLDRLQR